MRVYPKLIDQKTQLLLASATAIGQFIWLWQFRPSDFLVLSWGFNFKLTRLPQFRWISQLLNFKPALYFICLWAVLHNLSYLFPSSIPASRFNFWETLLQLPDPLFFSQLSWSYFIGFVFYGKIFYGLKNCFGGFSFGLDFFPQLIEEFGRKYINHIGNK